MHTLKYLLLFLSLSFAHDTVQAQLNDKGPKPVRQISFEELQEIMEIEDDTLRVINFWATWCKPCIAELPEFERVSKKGRMAQQPIKVLLVSLDFAENLTDRVIPFLKKRNITAQVLLLDDVDYDSWVSKVHSSWSGAIPATLIINNTLGIRKFEERTFENGELEQKLLSLLIDDN